MTNETRKRIRLAEGCPACSHKLGYEIEPSIKECAACGAIFGTTYLGRSYELVKPWFHKAPETVPVEATRYFDFTTLGSAGIGRRHGWYDPATRTIIQVG